MGIFRVARSALTPSALALALATGAAIPLSPVVASEIAADSPVEGVSAHAWAIADAETGDVLASQELEQPSNIASVTKLMTLFVIAQMAKADPTILDQSLTFSDRAASLKGTKTGLLADEKISVGDALYGLMLPSGNDAGYTLALHFGSGMVGSEQAATPAGAYKAFVAAMNRQARSLGMIDTRYSSAFGDSLNPDTKTSSARDQLILARAAMADPLVSRVVGTLDYEASVQTPEGSQRTVVWHNTNQLLGRPGVSGIKTGSNRSAGACLLTEVTVKGRRYHLAVLGSKSNADRYNDTLKVLAAATGRTLK